jgi:serine/threonine protein kinase
MLADEWNVCHSDIKPENIRIQASGNIKLGAFGSVSRTAPYESPE